MLKKFYLFFKGTNGWFLGFSEDKLSDLTKKIYDGREFSGFEDSEMLVVELTGISDFTYRVKYCNDGAWFNSSYINPFDNLWKDYVYRYASERIEDYLAYRSFEVIWYGHEVTSITKWVLKDGSSIAEFIIWLWNKGVFE